MLTIICPNFCKKEIAYTLDVILRDRLNILYLIKYREVNNISITYKNKKIILNQDFFLELNSASFVNTKKIDNTQHWNKMSVPWNINTIDNEIPVLFGTPEIKQDDETIEINIDLIGSIFFMLTRYEELGEIDLDYLGQFKVTSSLAYRCNFLNRPIVDEYIEIFWSALNQFWPQLKRQEESFSIVPTHDVDSPFLNISLPNMKRLVQRLGGDILYRKNIILMMNTLAGWLSYKLTGKLRYRNDPFDIFERLLILGEKHNKKSKYYFMTHKEDGGPLAGRYNIDAPEVLELIMQLADNGHEIGIHPTGESYINSTSFSEQANAYFAIKKKLNIKCPSGGRQHYLLWSPDVTASHWEHCKFMYDSTMAYNSQVGFRSGTCKGYPVWHHGEKRKMNLIEYPLILMDESLLGKTAMNLDYTRASNTIKELKNICKKMNGNFVFLWHNSSFMKEEDWQLYELCLTNDI